MHRQRYEPTTHWINKAGLSCIEKRIKADTKFQLKSLYLNSPGWERAAISAVFSEFTINFFIQVSVCVQTFWEHTLFTTNAARSFCLFLTYSLSVAWLPSVFLWLGSVGAFLLIYQVRKRHILSFYFLFSENLYFTISENFIKKKAFIFASEMCYQFVCPFPTGFMVWTRTRTVFLSVNPVSLTHILICFISSANTIRWLFFNTTPLLQKCGSVISLNKSLMKWPTRSQTL